MPVSDLRRSPDALDSLAPFKVLAAMCHPADQVRREKMLARIQSETGEGTSRRRGYSDDEFLSQVKLNAGRAGVAGDLLLTRLQLASNGYPSSLNGAWPLVSALLPNWQQPTGSSWSRESHVGHRPHSRRKMLDAYRDYLSVAHLWAAMVHGQHGRNDIGPGNCESLPLFLACAERFLDMACSLPCPRSDERFAMTRRRAWIFKIPERLVRRIDLLALPLDPKQIAVLDKLQACK